MKKLEIGNPCPEFTNTFVCHISMYFGDMDEMAECKIAVSNDRVDALEKLITTFRNDGWSEDYHKFENAYEFFGKDDEDLDDEENDWDARLSEWPYSYDCQCYAKHWHHEYHWYDAAGVKHEASLVEAE